MFWRKEAEILEAEHEAERLKAELEVVRAEKEALKTENETLKTEVERLNKLLAEQSAENFGSFIDEFVNGPKDDRTEVQRWATNSK